MIKGGGGGLSFCCYSPALDYFIEGKNVEVGRKEKKEGQDILKIRVILRNKEK